MRLMATILGLLLAALYGCSGGGGSAAVYYRVGGTLSGLATGATVDLSNVDGTRLQLSQNGGFSFPAALSSGTTYSISIAQQPAGQTCTVSGGQGTVAGADITTVTVRCQTNQFPIGGLLSGLPSGSNVILADNTSDTLTLTQNGAFTFTQPVAQGSTYSVSIVSPPTGATCTLTGASGTVSAAVSGISVNCAPTPPATGLASAYTHTVWQDNFSADSNGPPDPAHWAALTGNGGEYGVVGWGNNEAEYYLPANAVIANGALNLTGKADASVSNHRCANAQAICAFSSARLTSLDTVDLSVPGYLEVRAALPTAVGSWPAIWLLPGTSPGQAFPPSPSQQAGQPAWPSGGELDIVEYMAAFANPPNGVVQSTMHLPLAVAGGAQDHYEYEQAFPNSVNAVHVYQLEWTTGEIRFAVDDAVILTCSKATASCAPLASGSPVFPAGSQWPYGSVSQRYYLLLNLAIGGTCGISGSNNALIPPNYQQVMQVYSVRYLTP
jgi:beta-glucanase (GH16 family)